MIKSPVLFSKYASLFLLILITTISYGRSLNHQFVWDDHPIILDNPHLRKIENIPSFFLPYYWKYNHPGTKGQYRPLRTVSLSLSYYLWKFHPFGYHLTNLILHILNVLLIYLVVTRLFKSPKLAFFTSLLFALHPIHVESVSWVKNRTDLFSLFFFLLAFLFYLKYIPPVSNQPITNSRSITWLILSCLCFILSLMGKEIAITLPIIIFAYLIYFQPSSINKTFYPSLLPFFGIMIFYLFFIFIIINKGLPPDPNEIKLHPDIHLFLIIQTISSYISMILLPIKLNAERLIEIPLSLFNSSLILSISILILILSIFFKYYLPPKKEGFAITWFFVTLLPVINIKFMSGRPLAEQRLYIPSLGFCLLVALILIRNLPEIFKKQSLFLFVTRTFLTIAILSCYLALTMERDKIWHSNFTLWKDTVAKSPETFRSHFNLGSALSDRGEYEKAIIEFKKSIELNPKDHESYTSLGATYYRQGEMEKAKEMFLKAIDIFYNSYRAHNNLGNVYNVEGNHELALKEYQEAIKIKPDFAEAYYNMGNAYKDSGDIQKAISAFQKALEFEPDFAKSYYNLGNCFLITEEIEKAQKQFETAIRFDPSFINARYNLANIYYDKKAYSQAIEQLMAILKLDPNHVESHYLMGSIFTETGKLDKALKEYKEVIRIFPDHADALNSLGKIYMKKGEVEKGKIQFEKALKIDPQNGYVHYNLGKLYVIEGDYQAAQKEFEESLKLNPSIAEAWFNLGVIFHKTGKNNSAVEALKKATAVKSDYLDAYFHLGNLYLQQKQFHQAIASFQQALKVKPSHPESHLKLGLIYLYNLNDASNALIHLKKVIELAPNHPHAFQIREAISFLEQ